MLLGPRTPSEQQSDRGKSGDEDRGCGSNTKGHRKEGPAVRRFQWGFQVSLDRELFPPRWDFVAQGFSQTALKCQSPGSEPCLLHRVPRGDDNNSTS